MVYFYSDSSALGAEVMLNGKCQGVMTPERDRSSLMLTNIPVGTYQVTVRKKGYGDFQQEIRVSSSDQPADRTPKVVVRAQLVEVGSSAGTSANSVPNFAGIWAEINPEDPAHPLRLRVVQSGAQIACYTSYTQVFGNGADLEATISQGRATTAMPQGCSPKFQKAGYNYDKPGIDIRSISLRGSILVYEQDTKWTSPCDGHSIGVEQDIRELNRVSQ